MCPSLPSSRRSREQVLGRTRGTCRNHSTRARIGRVQHFVGIGLGAPSRSSSVAADSSAAISADTAEGATASPAAVAITTSEVTGPARRTRSRGRLASGIRRAGKPGRRVRRRPPGATMTRPPVRSANPSFLHSDRVLARAAQPVVRFLHIEAAGGILLVGATDGCTGVGELAVAGQLRLVVVDDDRARHRLVPLRGGPRPRRQRLVHGVVLLRRRHGDQTRARRR